MINCCPCCSVIGPSQEQQAAKVIETAKLLEKNLEDLIQMTYKKKEKKST